MQHMKWKMTLNPSSTSFLNSASSGPFPLPSPLPTEPQTAAGKPDTSGEMLTSVSGCQIWLSYSLFSCVFSRFEMIIPEIGVLATASTLVRGPGPVESSKTGSRDFYVWNNNFRRVGLDFWQGSIDFRNVGFGFELAGIDFQQEIIKWR